MFVFPAHASLFLSNFFCFLFGGLFFSFFLVADLSLHQSRVPNDAGLSNMYSRSHVYVVHKGERLRPH